MRHFLEIIKRIPLKKETGMMENRTITEAMISHFTDVLKEEERSAATICKYVRDIRRFARFAGQ